MSTQTEITRIQSARNTLRNKGVELGLVESTAKIDVIATAFGAIDNQGAISANVMEGESYTIPRGYHNGSGVVKGVSGGGNYELQGKTVTPTKKQQAVTADSGYYGLSGVTVEAIQDVSPVTAGAADVLANKIIVNAAGESVAGTMPNNGAVNKTLDTAAPTYTVPKGYHSGAGTVKIVTEEKAATPTKAAQTVSPTSGKVLSKVTVEAIPDNYIDTTDADAKAGEILQDRTAYVGGVKLEGTMPNNGDVSEEFDGLTVRQVTIPAGYTSGGIVSLSGDIEEALAAI